MTMHWVMVPTLVPMVSRVLVLVPMMLVSVTQTWVWVTKELV